MNDKIFHEWFEHHFLEYAPSGRSLLLLLDGHSSDYNPTFTCCAAQKGVMMNNLWYRRVPFLGLQILRILWIFGTSMKFVSPKIGVNAIMTRPNCRLKRSLPFSYPVDIVHEGSQMPTCI